jgi:hypothetical protein
MLVASASRKPIISYTIFLRIQRHHVGQEDISETYRGILNQFVIKSSIEICKVSAVQIDKKRSSYICLQKIVIEELAQDHICEGDSNLL